MSKLLLGLAILCTLNCTYKQETKADTSGVQNRITALEALTVSLEAQISANSALISQLQNDYATNAAAIQQLTYTSTTNNAQLTALQANYSAMLAELAQVQGYVGITDVYDPCGDKPGIFDEVFLHLSSGEYLASFSDNANGLNTRFAKLTPGTFRTTDNSACTFTVVSAPTAEQPDKVIITGEHY